MCKRCRCNHKMNKRVCKVCECIGTVYTFMNSWKEPFNTYNSSMWIFSLFWLLNWFSGLLSIGQYRSFLSAAAILFILVMQKRPPSYERIKTEKVHRVMNERIKTKHVTVLLSNQKARKRFTYKNYCFVILVFSVLYQTPYNKISNSHNDIPVHYFHLLIA